jgi:hypothetical protein
MAKLTKSLSSALCAGIFSIALAPCVYAVPGYVIDQEKLIGINNIEIGSSVYNVAFKDSSYESIFGSDGSGLDFTTEADADAASSALGALMLDSTLVGATSYNFDSDPFLTFGCESNQYGCGIITAYTTPNASNNITGFLFDNQTSEPDGFYSDSFSYNYNVVSDKSYVYADWELVSSSSVAEPQVALLLAIGLLGIFGVTRAKARA